MIGAKLTLASLYFGCFVVVFNLFQLDAFYGLVSSFLVILLLSHQQMEREAHMRQLEDDMINAGYWGGEYV